MLEVSRQVTLEEMERRVTEGKKFPIGFTCSTFDLLHAGHMLMLAECKRYCATLLVGLEVDPSVDRPTKNKPVQSLEERTIILRGNRYIDDVLFVYYNEEELMHRLQEHTDRIDIRFVGADWKGKPFTGYGLPIPIFFNSRDHGYSTTELRNRIYEAEAARRGALILPEKTAA